MRTAFSYYGGKGMLAGKYPKPKHKKIVELFAGGASYALRYYKHDCILVDKNKNLVAAWKFIQRPNLQQLKKIPEHIEPGTKISDFGEVDPGFEFILRAAANVGTAGQNKKMETITKIGAIHFFKNTVLKVLYWTDKIQHWDIRNGSYDNFDFGLATYFIDPPYQNDAGKLYKFGAKTIDYDHLKQFVLNLFGQIIITENHKSHWVKSFRKYDLKRSCGINAKHISGKRQSEVFIHFLKYANQALNSDG